MAQGRCLKQTKDQHHTMDARPLPTLGSRTPNHQSGPNQLPATLPPRVPFRPEAKSAGSRTSRVAHSGHLRCPLGSTLTSTETSPTFRRRRVRSSSSHSSRTTIFRATTLSSSTSRPSRSSRRFHSSNRWGSRSLISSNSTSAQATATV